LGKVKELQHLSLATTYEVDSTFDSDKFIKMSLRVCHDGVNPNKSSFKVEDMEKAKESIENIPILANVIFDEDGNPQFSGHDMEIEEDKVNEGDYRLIYKETPIGVVPQNCNHRIEKFDGKDYVYVDCYIWKGYSNYAEDIIERDKDIKLSMEILVDEYSYNAKEKVYNISAYRYQGITFLNKNYGTGMENALATTGTFEENDSKQKFIMMMEELKETLSNYDINKSEKGGSEVDEEMIALLNKYSVTSEQLDFSIEGMTIDEVEAKLKEKFDDQNKHEDDNKEPEKYVKSFELSHEDVRYALYNLLSPVESDDNEWYFIDHVYDNYFEYMNWDGTKIYRQGYAKDGDNISFSGDRIELFQERLTKEEKEALDKMRSNYSILEDEVKVLRDYQAEKFAEERKEAEDVLFEQFAELSGIEEFEELKKNSSKFELDVIEKECYAILGKKNAKFISNKQNKKDKVKIEFSKKEDKPVDEYGELFEKYLPKKD
jgi:hypothetical protein